MAKRRACHGNGAEMWHIRGKASALMVQHRHTSIGVSAMKQERILDKRQNNIHEKEI